jgi:hypothetical protein
MIAANTTAGKARIMSQILTVAAVSAFSWSFPLLKAWDSLTALQWAAVVSALVLTIGAIIEYWEKLKLLALLVCKWILRRINPTELCVLRKLAIHSLGPILVVIGIAGDFVFEGRAFILEDRQEEQSRRIIGSLSEKAATAESKADSAITKSDKLGNIEDTIQLRLDAASTELSGIEQRVRVQGPRWELLEDNQSEFIDAMMPFSGQPATIIGMKCGDAVQTEPRKLAWDLLNFLGMFTTLKHNPGWRGIYREWHTCKVWPTAEGGNVIAVSSSASQAVKDAAKALCGTLNKIGISTMGYIIPDSPELRSQVDTDEGTDSPDSLALKDPTQVFIMVGINPGTVDTFGERKLHKRSKP